MKRIIYIIILCIITITISIAIIPKDVYSTEIIKEIPSPWLEEEFQREEWKKEYYSKVLFLNEYIDKMFSIMMINVVLFSLLILFHKGCKHKKIVLIYKIFQIIVLLWILIMNIILAIIPPEPGISADIPEPDLEDWFSDFLVEWCANIAILTVILFITIFIQKKFYLKIFLLFGQIILFCTKMLMFMNEFQNEEIIRYCVIIESLLFLPLYLSKKELKEGENVRI